MTQDSLHGLRFNFGLVHKPVAERVTEVVKSEPMPILDLHSCRFRSWPEMVSDKYRRGKRYATMRLERRKDKVPILLVERLASPPL